MSKKKIAILGGGCAAMSAAWGLTSKPNWQDEYEITVYQMGWRLGGKGASGRNPHVHQRIEEHGLHVWAGYYENAFRVMREAYGELNRSPDQPLATWDEAFKPQSNVTHEERVNGRWVHWNFNFPERSATPGDGKDFPRDWQAVGMAIEWLIAMLEKNPDLVGLPTDQDPSSDPEMREDVAKTVSRWNLMKHRPLSSLLCGRWKKIVYNKAHAIQVKWLHYALRCARACKKNPLKHPTAFHEAIIWLINAFKNWLHDVLEHEIENNDRARRLFILTDFSIAQTTGFIRDKLFINGFGAIDDREWSDWLRDHGARPMTLDSSVVRSMYDYLFAYENGRRQKRSIGAGTCMRCITRMAFFYKGAFFWKMQAGMGDVVFTPLYQVLKRRGVKFKFFHRVKNLGVSSGGRRIDTIRLGRQVTLKSDEYEPLVTIKGLDSWPSFPDYPQIADDEAQELQDQNIDLESAWTPWQDREEIVLRRGQDFDDIVLGISVAGLKQVCRELIEQDARWRDMVDKVQTVQTQAMQLWFKPALDDMGWEYGSTTLTTYAEPLETWADLTNLLPAEDWPAELAPQSLAYHCAPLEDAEVIPPPARSDFPQQEKDRLKRELLQWLRRFPTHLWPKVASRDDPDGLDFNQLVDPQQSTGEDRFDAQYWRANMNPTDRYVLSVPGSLKYRMKADESGYENLYLAGDWIRNGLNLGCVESAVMGGLQASRAICGSPQAIPGEHDGLR